jgi:hypothetical protein
VVAFVRGRTLLFSRRRLIVSSSHLVHHELVDSHSLACVPSCVACVWWKPLVIPVLFYRGKTKIAAGWGCAETAETAETAVTVVTAETA